MNSSTSHNTLFSQPATLSVVEMSREGDAPVAYNEPDLCATSRAGYVDGRVGDELQSMPANDSGVITLVVVTFLAALFGLRHSSRLFRTFAQDLWSTRRRENAFDDRTASDSQVVMAMVFQSCVYQGLLLFLHFDSVVDVAIGSIFGAAMAVVGVILAFYLVQLLVITVVGHVFSDKMGAVQWIKGFNASQILLGFAIAVPTLIALFYPETTNAMWILGVFLYFVARVIFICKGFRIFYHNFGSLLYFILYLCTLEIIPLIWVYSVTRFLVDLLQ